LSDQISIVAKTKQRKSFIEFDKDRKVYFVGVKSSPENNKANIEILKLISKKFGKNARIISGRKSKKKLIGLS